MRRSGSFEMGILELRTSIAEQSREKKKVDIDRSRAETDRSREATELMQERNERIGRQIEAFPWNSSVLQDEIDHQHSLNEAPPLPFQSRE